MQGYFAYIKLSILSLICLPWGCAQNTTGVHVKNLDFDHQLSRLLQFNVPVISVDSLYHQKDNFIILDTRTHEEYNMSHIEGARFLDYSNPDYAVLERESHDTPIVVYCSVGYRSEKIGKKLLEMGYTNVRNLYGSIFEWVNEGYPIVKEKGFLTDSIHTYNERWSRYVNNKEIIKTW